MKQTITYADFAKIEMRVGTIVEASIPEGSKKLIRQVVDFGEDIGTRVIFSGILRWYQPIDLVGKQAVYVINLEPRPMMGEESQGMLVAVTTESESGENGCALLHPDSTVLSGSEVI